MSVCYDLLNLRNIIKVISLNVAILSFRIFKIFCILLNIRNLKFPKKVNEQSVSQIKTENILI